MKNEKKKLAAKQRIVRWKFPDPVIELGCLLANYLNPTRAAQILKISKSTLYRWRHENAQNHHDDRFLRLMSDQAVVTTATELVRRCEAVQFSFDARVICVEVGASLAERSRAHDMEPFEGHRAMAVSFPPNKSAARDLQQRFLSAKSGMIDESKTRSVDARWQHAKAMIEEKGRLGQSALNIAEVIGITDFHLIRAFRNAFGVTPHKYLIACRVDAAIEILASSGVTIDAAAAAAGFGSGSALRRAFVKATGMSASQLLPRERRGL